jgi:hypothetical protein
MSQQKHINSVGNSEKQSKITSHNSLKTDAFIGSRRDVAEFDECFIYATHGFSLASHRPS